MNHDAARSHADAIVRGAALPHAIAAAVVALEQLVCARETAYSRRNKLRGFPPSGEERPHR